MTYNVYYRFKYVLHVSASHKGGLVATSTSANTSALNGSSAEAKAISWAIYASIMILNLLDMALWPAALGKGKLHAQQQH
jgi:hypothetical protein